MSPSLGRLLRIGSAAALCAAGGRAWAAEAPAVSSETRADDPAVETALRQLQARKDHDKISGSDLLEITVFEVPELCLSARVRENGDISFPLIGTVRVGGRSVAEAESLMAEKLKEYVVAPQVTIFVKEYGNRKVFVLGEVKKPGSYDLPSDSRLTVLEAISLAEGFTSVAAQDRTRVIRTVDGKSQDFVVAIPELAQPGEKQKDIVLEPDDVVWVPQGQF